VLQYGVDVSTAAVFLGVTMCNATMHAEAHDAVAFMDSCVSHLQVQASAFALVAVFASVVIGWGSASAPTQTNYLHGNEVFWGNAIVFQSVSTYSAVAWAGCHIVSILSASAQLLNVDATFALYTANAHTNYLHGSAWVLVSTWYALQLRQCSFVWQSRVVGIAVIGAGALLALAAVASEQSWRPHNDGRATARAIIVGIPHAYLGGWLSVVATSLAHIRQQLTTSKETSITINSQELESMSVDAAQSTSKRVAGLKLSVSDTLLLLCAVIAIVAALLPDPILVLPVIVTMVVFSNKNTPAWPLLLLCVGCVASVVHVLLLF